MDDVESRLGDVLGDPAGRSAQGLADRVHRGVAVRRSRRRALAFAAAACAVVLAVGVPVAWREAGEESTMVANSIDGLEDLVDMPGSVALPKETQDAAASSRGAGRGRVRAGPVEQGEEAWETGPEVVPLRPLNEDAARRRHTGSGIRVWPGTISSPALLPGPERHQTGHAVEPGRIAVLGQRRDDRRQ